MWAYFHEPFWYLFPKLQQKNCKHFLSKRKAFTKLCDKNGVYKIMCMSSLFRIWNLPLVVVGSVTALSVALQKKSTVRSEYNARPASNLEQGRKHCCTTFLRKRQGLLCAFPA
jgi:hypothetical protein